MCSARLGKRQRVLRRFFWAAQSRTRYSAHPRQKELTHMQVAAALVLSVCFLVSTPTMAAWAVVQRDEFGTSYIDLDTRHSTKDGMAVWTLYDSEIPSEAGPGQFSHSTRVKTEFNCDQRVARTLATVSYSQRMASGQVIEVKQRRAFGASQIIEDWEPISPATGRSKLIALVCSK